MQTTTLIHFVGSLFWHRPMFAFLSLQLAAFHAWQRDVSRSVDARDCSSYVGLYIHALVTARRCAGNQIPDTCVGQAVNSACMLSLVFVNAAAGYCQILMRQNQ